MKKYADAVAEWWVRNAEIRHGHVPRTGEVQAETIKALEAQVASQESVATKDQGNKGPGVLPYVLGAALTAAGLGGGMLIPLAWNALAGSDTPAAMSPIEKSGSLYQHLEDQGLHLPQ